MKIRRACALASVMLIPSAELLMTINYVFHMPSTTPLLKGNKPCFPESQKMQREGKHAKPCNINKTLVVKVVLKREVYLYYILE